jgi:hypothetical protein
MTVRIGTVVGLMALAAVVLIAGCGKAARPEAASAAHTAAATTPAAATSPAPPGNQAQRAVSPQKRATQAATGPAAAPGGPVTSCRGPNRFYRLSSSPHGGALPRCWRFQPTGGPRGGGGRP